ncbi:MAG TPA: 3-deoxy-manno-octulosonate cytidylyltransferase [Gammaproteobacteria bacterium]
MAFRVVIPARYASTRLPGKPLLDIAGKPMVQHVYERARESGASHVIVATDDQRIAEVVQGFGGEVCMTDINHKQGTERIAEVVTRLEIGDEEIIVNLQGDEPLMPPQLLKQVADNLASHASVPMATLCTRIHTAAELFDPHVVKVVSDSQGYALYFSRAVIPWDRDAFAVTTEELPEKAEHYRHLGIYAYRAGFIRDYVNWPACQLETMESLEQLRVLWHGRRIHVDVALESPGHGVDTPADLEKVRELMAKRMV